VRAQSLLIAIALFAALGAPANAQLAAPSKPQEALQLYLEHAASGLPGRVEVSVGALDARVDLSRCARIEPFLPHAARLWGRGWVGVRCTEGPALTAYFPVHVKVFGPALVAVRGLAAGSAVGPADVRIDERELTREPPGVLSELAGVAERVLARPILAGQPLRAEYFRLRPAVTFGDPVRLVYSGPGFTVTTEGRAMGSAAPGQPVRVQSASGRTFTGTALDGRIVRVAH
jgi:flagella basal body P-ring formation protein FlgA